MNIPAFTIASPIFNVQVTFNCIFEQKSNKFRSLPFFNDGKPRH